MRSDVYLLRKRLKPQSLCDVPSSPDQFRLDPVVQASLGYS